MFTSIFFLNELNFVFRVWVYKAIRTTAGLFAQPFNYGLRD